MKLRISRSSRRLGVVLHYCSVSIVAVIIMFETTATLAAVGAAAFLAAIITWIYAHVVTGASRFADTKFDKLDEREMQVLHEAFRRSYYVYRKIALVLMIVASILFKSTPFHNNHVVFAPVLIILLYVSLNLPTSIVAWTEREIYRD